MELYEILQLPYGASRLERKDDLLVCSVGKVYPTDSIGSGILSKKHVGELPNSEPPQTLGDVPAYCQRWIDFALTELAQQLGEPAKIFRPVMLGLQKAVDAMPDAPAFPKSHPVNYMSRNVPLEVVRELKRVRDWAADLLKGEVGRTQETANARKPAKTLEAPQADWSEAKSPAELLVDLKCMEVSLGDDVMDCDSKQALRWVKVLAEHPGEWISSTELKKYDENLFGDPLRPDRLKKHLPPAILALIETDRRKGSRIRLP